MKPIWIFDRRYLHAFQTHPLPLISKNGPVFYDFKISVKWQRVFSVKNFHRVRMVKVTYNDWWDWEKWKCERYIKLKRGKEWWCESTWEPGGMGLRLGCSQFMCCPHAFALYKHHFTTNMRTKYIYLINWVWYHLFHHNFLTLYITFLWSFYFIYISWFFFFLILWFPFIFF